MSNNSVVKTTISGLKNRLPLYIRANKPVMIWGGPGEGKSGVIRYIVDKMGADLQDYRLLMRDTVDVHGIPKEQNGRMAWCYPEEIPLASDNIERLRVMFLDEITAASTGVQTVAYQMLHERAIDNKPLHANVRFLAAGNRERDGAVSNPMPSALRGRFAHFDVTADIESFLEFGMNKGVNSYILAHLENSPLELRVVDEREYISSKAFRSPRAWEYASDVMNEYLKDVDTVTAADLEVMSEIVASFCGGPTAVSFHAYASIGGKLPKTRDILEGRVKASRHELPEQFFISCGVLSMLNEEKNKLIASGKLSEREYFKDENFTKYVDNIFTYVKDSFDSETLAAFVSRFFGPNFYGFRPNPGSKTQSEWAQWCFKGQEGAAKLVFAK